MKALASRLVQRVAQGDLSRASMVPMLARNDNLAPLRTYHATSNIASTCAPAPGKVKVGWWSPGASPGATYNVRWLTQDAQPAEERSGTDEAADSGGAAQPGEVLEHKFPLSTAAKRVKIFSLSTTAAAFAAAPYLTMYHPQGAPLAISFCILGIFTTSLLHWFTQPYIHHMKYDPATDMVEARQLTWWTGSKVTTFKVADIVYPLDTYKPLAMFKVGGIVYYADKNFFPDEELLQRLTPPSPYSYAEPLAYDDDEDSDDYYPRRQPHVQQEVSSSAPGEGDQQEKENVPEQATKGEAKI